MKAILATLVGFSLACGGRASKPGGLCWNDADCESGLCQNGECGGDPCDSNADCDPAAVCDNLGDSGFTYSCYRPCSSGCSAQEQCTVTGYCGP